ncbi:hypothetical protein LTR66_004470 [Elasticomyces elasticus]|nr:hypothetical protein LTR66_004470 [Elasticomyces elasticus]
MPQIIQPPGGMPKAPLNTSLIQIGFDYSLNYDFVAANSQSADQIFTFLPQGLAYALNVGLDNVTMHALQPFDTSKTLGYITTIALAYIPRNMVDQLQLDLHTPVSSMYNNPSPPVKTLFSMINPSIPVLAGATMNGVALSGTNENSSPTTSAAAGNGAPMGGDSGKSSPVRSTSVGIGVGVAAGAAVYAAAMVYLARRYRNKKARHERADSMPSAGEGMAQVGGGGMGGYFMSGGRGPGRVSPTSGRDSRNSAGSSNGRSVREQGISAPVMAENSLGWN